MEILHKAIEWGGSIFKANPAGCRTCGRAGYKGRIGIHELLMLDDTIRECIMDRSNSSVIRSKATGMHSLRYDGAEKVLRGMTSVEEVLRVTQTDVFD